MPSTLVKLNWQQLNKPRLLKEGTQTGLVRKIWRVVVGTTWELMAMILRKDGATSKEEIAEDGDNKVEEGVTITVGGSKEVGEATITAGGSKVEEGEITTVGVNKAEGETTMVGVNRVEEEATITAGVNKVVEATIMAGANKVVEVITTVGETQGTTTAGDYSMIHPFTSTLSTINKFIKASILDFPLKPMTIDCY